MSKKKKHSSSGKKPQAKETETLTKPSETPETENEQAEVHMNFYSAMSMLSTVVAAGTMIFAMVIAGRGLYYVVQSVYDENQADLSIVVASLEEESYAGDLRACLYAAGIILGVVTVLSLTQTAIAINPKKKPVLVLSLLTEALAIVPVVVYAISQTYVKDIAAAYDRIEKTDAFTLFRAYPIVLMINLLFCLVNVSGQIYGLYKYNKTGKTC